MSSSVKAKKKVTKPADKKKAVKKTVPKSSVKEEVPVVEEAPVVEETPVVEESSVLDTTMTEESSLVEDSKSEDKKDPIVDILTSLLHKYEALEKESRVCKNDLKKAIKLYQKKSFKSKRKHNPNRTPSGFAKPSVITDELCKFLNKPLGSKMARTDVTREVNNYIKKHNLQNPENKKKISPDKTLRTLLKVSEDDTSLTYFSMQKYLKDHFPKEDTTVVS